jgi:pyrroloquinoline-quinone synthase
MGFAERVRAALEPLHLLRHPFYRDWSEGKLSLDTLRHYAAEYYRHVDAFPRYVSAVHSQAADAAARRVLAENLADEEGLGPGATPHPELWLRFAEGLGVDRGRVESAAGGAAARALVERFFELGRRGYEEGLGALYAYESQVPEVATAKIDGLVRHYGIDDERTLAFFRVHEKADVEHRRACEGLLDRIPPGRREATLAAARAAAQGLWDFLTAMQAACAAA